ncbi:hypothetical protein L2K70_01765 [Nocardioides KLBMP 9356]|uniref:Uncharacterized protein n=1 Tax=Nocardioides potassii TaxID=2911371 RepID=A0ABS9H808_9ACTN|nr:hypothetical protein [Nocardioides potassii]MCF6376325.1 hypothetical protein [Nocardioides potassii]
MASLAAAVGAGYALGAGHEPNVPPVVAPPLVLANADLTATPSCDELLDSYVERGLEQVGPYGWGSGIVMFDSAAGSDASSPTAWSARPAPR